MFAAGNSYRIGERRKGAEFVDLDLKGVLRSDKQKSLAPLAQLAEQLTLNQRVSGSSPERGIPLPSIRFER